MTKKLCTKCDICGRNPLDVAEQIALVNGEASEPTFVDGKTFSGPWADMCEDCYSRHGVRDWDGEGSTLFPHHR